jgi:pimeloyl-ACP methyl ester carboxylesterase
VAPLARQTVLAVIPGNPGDAVFYRDFARALEAHGHEVTVTSHLLLAAPPESLLPYAVHQVEGITSYLARTGRSLDAVEVVLVGHSVGAYLSYLIVARRLLPVSRVFLLCPFLARPSLSGRLILKVVTASRLFAGFLRLWRALPGRLQRGLIAAAGAGPHGTWVQEALASRQPQGWATMAAAEVREIASRADASYVREEPLFRDRERVVSVLAPRDRWAPDRWAEALAPGSRVDGVSHAFVVHPEQCRTVARLIHDRLSLASS